MAGEHVTTVIDPLETHSFQIVDILMAQISGWANLNLNKMTVFS